MFLALAMMFVSSSMAQSHTEFNAEQWFTSHPEAEYQSLDVEPSRSKSAARISQNLPGDEKLAMLNTSAQFVRKGQTLQAQLVAIKDWSEPVIIAAQMLYPGPSGRYDQSGRVTYFNARSGVRYGLFPKGLSLAEVVDVYSTIITEDFQYGEHVLNVVVIEAKSGRLIQQIFGRFFVQFSGPEGRFFHRLERGTLDGPSANQKTLRLEGAFTAGEAVLVYIGVPGLFHEVYQGSSRDGKTVLIPLQFGAGRDQMLDVTALYAGTRESSTIQVQVKADPKQ